MLKKNILKKFKKENIAYFEEKKRFLIVIFVMFLIIFIAIKLFQIAYASYESEAKLNANIEKALQKEQKTSGYATSPVVKKNPMLLNTLHLTKNKGFCLVEYNKKYSLIGYINNEIFLLNQFDNVSSVEIRSRLSETIDNKDRYIVRLGGYKALIEVSDSDMNLLVNL